MQRRDAIATLRPNRTAVEINMKLENTTLLRNVGVSGVIEACDTTRGLTRNDHEHQLNLTRR